MPAPRNLSRRRFLTHSAALAAGAAVSAKLAPPGHAADPAKGEFVSNWHNCPDRVWLGPEFWSNPLQDWRVADGRIECTNPAVDRNVHLLVRSLGEPGGFDLKVRVGRTGGGALVGNGSVGFRIGVRGPLPDFRNSLVFGRGLDAGLTADGGLFIGEIADAKPGTVKLDLTEALLHLTGEPEGDNYALTLSVSDKSGRRLGTIAKAVPRERCLGNLVLVNNFGAAAAAGAGKAPPSVKKETVASSSGLGTFWFADWRIAGGNIGVHPERTFGPLLFSQYTLSGGVMKMSAQLPPLGANDNKGVRLEIKIGATWESIGEASMHPAARTVAFRIANWDAAKDVEYRLAYRLTFRDGRAEDHYWGGTVRRDPISQSVISVADISCNYQAAFPNAPYVANVAKLNPDLIAFTGDQFYENSGGYGVVRGPGDVPMIDYLRKWYMHGWTWRELTRDRPSVSLPDDHDVYHGNLWGEGGAGRTTTVEVGGYDMPAEWVNVVHRTQTIHHPDAHDPAPGKRGTLQYYSALTYGRVSFAILADRQYKSGPEGKVPPTGGRGDHETNPNFDPKTSDIAGLSLLGDKQEAFLRDWVRDWRGAEMKVVISQTLFTAFPTTHGSPGPRGLLRADYDTNAWPQTARNRAVREMRRAFAFHLAGDQHIPGLVQYGVDEHRDGPVAFAGPAINVGYPRWFEPERAPWTKPKQKGLTGDFTDSFGHPLTVLAVKNGATQPRQNNVMDFLEDKASGLGMVYFDKPRRKIRIDCWPFRADAAQASAQFPGWPVEIDVLDNYKRTVVGHLPPLNITGTKQPVIEVIDEVSDELLYILRTNEPSFRPHVFAVGKYRVKVSDPETGKSSELRQLEPTTQMQRTITVRL